jgi:hypothetical protein
MPCTHRGLEGDREQDQHDRRHDADAKRRLGQRAIVIVEQVYVLGVQSDGKHRNFGEQHPHRRILDVDPFGALLRANGRRPLPAFRSAQTPVGDPSAVRHLRFLAVGGIRLEQQRAVLLGLHNCFQRGVSPLPGQRRHL